MSKKLIVKTTTAISLKESETYNLADLQFDLKQFKIPQRFVALKSEISQKMEKAQNHVGEYVETGLVTITFKAYDRAFAELVINNGGTELGSPISIVVEHLDELPILDSYEEDELIPVHFDNLKVHPKKIQKKSFVGEGKPMIDTWQFAALKVCATNYHLGEPDSAPTSPK
jgi:hypothetical protein